MQSALSDSNQFGVRPLTKLFRALGDETRLRIVALLSHGELCVCHIEKALDLSQPNVSRQLAILRAAGVVDARREGTWVYYSLAAQEHAAVDAMLGVLVRSFGAERAIRSDHAKLRKSCGPDACK
ncbi:MAG TPA: metalloregulator ArsR/SmtB family transcription factor [Kofleriaceae bacterium]|nr:metalloregulator ArsR/SmtB family transcription factor [Kofleriaceae bacterium]